MELYHQMSSAKMYWSELVSATNTLIICINQKIKQFKESLEHFALITIKKDVWPYCTYMYAELKIWTFLNLLFCAKNINKTIFRWLKQQMIWCLTCCFYANCTLKYKTLSFNYLELCSFRFKYIENVKEGRSCLLSNYLLRKRLNQEVGSNFYKGIHVFREKLFFSKTIWQEKF